MLLTLQFKEESNMALVKCPECGKEVSDTANACPNCGYGVKVHFDNLKQKRQAELRKKQLEIEKRNRQIQLKNDYEERVSKVPMPNKPKLSRRFITYIIIITFFFTFLFLLAPREKNLSAWLFEMVIFVIIPLCIYGYYFFQRVRDYKLSKTNFRKYQEQVIREKDLERAKTQARLAAQKSSSQVRCPKCGSTNFQMVNRKWSPLTGFMTNKVDRVCVNCKNRF